ncbi:hypothetical protein MMC25_002989 [Agyrium rufum]|nr:hypothetical protein [Agyrium rufum]
MQFSTATTFLSTLALFSGLSSATGTGGPLNTGSVLNLWTNNACTAPLGELHLPDAGCYSYEFSGTPASGAYVANVEHCVPTVYAYSNTNCDGPGTIVSSASVTTCVSAGTKPFVSYMVTSPCPELTS